MSEQEQTPDQISEAPAEQATQEQEATKKKREPIPFVKRDLKPEDTIVESDLPAGFGDGKEGNFTLLLDGKEIGDDQWIQVKAGAVQIDELNLLACIRVVVGETKQRKNYLNRTVDEQDMSKPQPEPEPEQPAPAKTEKKEEVKGKLTKSQWEQYIKLKVGDKLPGTELVVTKIQDYPKTKTRNIRTKSNLTTIPLEW